MAKTIEEKRTEIEQKIRRLKKEKRKLDRQEQADARKHRDHVMIVTGAHFLTHYPGAEAQLLTMSDDEIRRWVDGKFRSGNGGGN